MLFNLVFAKNTFFHEFFLFFLIIGLHFLIPSVITQIFNPTVKLVIPTGIAMTEAKAKIETQLVNIEAKMSKCLI